jgi:RNA polymerase sigma-70 factor (ECF subfamily)
MLGISTGASKSNLHKARHKLKEMILKTDSSSNRSRLNNGSDDYTSMVVAIKTTEINSISINNNIGNGRPGKKIG